MHQHLHLYHNLSQPLQPFLISPNVLAKAWYEEISFGPIMPWPSILQCLDDASVRSAGKYPEIFLNRESRKPVESVVDRVSGSNSADERHFIRSIGC